MFRYPYSVCNLPHVVIRLRKHDDSKSALQATALTEASAVVRWGLVQHTFKIEDKSHAPHSLNDEKDCDNKHSRHSVYIPSKRHLDCLVHPSQHVHSRRDAEYALTMLGKLYQACISQFKSYNISLLKLTGIDPMEEEEGCEYDALGQQGIMIRDLLQDAMVTSGKKVYQAGRLDAVVTKPTKQDINTSLEAEAEKDAKEEEGLEEIAGEDSQSHSTGVEEPIPWEKRFYPDDWMKIKTVAGADIMRGLFDLNI